MPLKTNGAKLRERRELKALTITEFAELAGYSVNHCSQVELGKRPGSPRFVRTAAQVLACGIGDITDGLVSREALRDPAQPTEVAS